MHSASNILIPVAAAFLGICGNQAREMYNKGNHASASGWMTIALTPAMLLAFYITAAEGFTVAARNVVLGTLGAALGCFLAILLGYKFAGTTASAQDEKNKASTESRDSKGVSVSGNDNVVSVGQIGGITARIVNVNPPEHPELRILGNTVTDQPGGVRLTRIKVAVAAPVTPGLLILDIKASNMKSTDITAEPVGGLSRTAMQNVRFHPENGTYSAEIPTPRGVYIIDVRTIGPSEIRLNASF